MCHVLPPCLVLPVYCRDGTAKIADVVSTAVGPCCPPLLPLLTPPLLLLPQPEPALIMPHQAKQFASNQISPLEFLHSFFPPGHGQDSGPGLCDRRGGHTGLVSTAAAWVGSAPDCTAACCQPLPAIMRAAALLPTG